jgi:hypothetical protein
VLAVRAMSDSEVVKHRSEVCDREQYATVLVKLPVLVEIPINTTCCPTTAIDTVTSQDNWYWLTRTPPTTSNIEQNGSCPHTTIYSANSAWLTSALP